VTTRLANAHFASRTNLYASALSEQVDALVERRRFRNRSQAIEAALADKLRRLARTRLATESAKLNPREEKRLADEGLAEDLATWPEY
jgi:Arc/MetJ-type ribon-helix-helix transcriptional regulator